MDGTGYASFCMLHCGVIYVLIKDSDNRGIFLIS